MAIRKRRWGILWTGVLTLGLLALPTSAYGADGCEGGGGPGPSTPGLRIQISNPSSAEWKITAVASVGDDGSPTANLVLWNEETRLYDFDVHRVALRGEHDDHTSPPEDSGRDGVKATIRGAGVNEQGERVQVWIDVVDNGNRANVDQARLRIRPLTDHGGEHEDGEHEGGDHDDGCGGSGGGGTWTDWMTVRQVHVFLPAD